MALERAAEDYPDQVVGLIPLLRHVLVARVDRPDDVDDMVQECVTRLLDLPGRLGPDTLAGYAVVVARNVAASHARTAGRHRRHLPRLVDLAAPPDPAEEAVRSQEFAALNQALDQLPPSERETLVAHDAHGVDTATLARHLDSSPGGVATRLGRTRARLRLEYVLALTGANLPSARCRPVLLALSAGDARRQHALNASSHLATCAVCPALSPPLVERQRGALVAVLLLAAGRRVVPVGRWLQAHQAHSAVAGTMAATAVVAAVVVVAQPHHRLTPPTSPAVSVVTAQTAPPPPAALSAGAADLLAAIAASPVRTVLGVRSGHAVQAMGVTVQALAGQAQPSGRQDDERFWVGYGPGRRILVFAHINAEPAFQITPGQRYNFTAAILSVPANVRDLGLDPAAAAEVTVDGYYVEITSTATLHPAGART